MVKYLVVYWHPEPKSFNGSCFKATVAALEAAGHEVRTSDLHEMKWNADSGRHNFTKEDNPEFFKQQLEEMAAVKSDGFAPEVKAEQEKLEWCDVLIMQFPLWWFSFPAVMKGWVDRIFAMGVSYGGGKGIYADGPYKGKKAVLNISTGGPEPAYAPGDDSFNGDINGVLRPIHRGVLEFTGFSVLKPNLNWAVAHGTDEQRQATIDAWAARATNLHEEAPIVVGRYA